MSTRFLALAFLAATLCPVPRATAAEPTTAEMVCSLDPSCKRRLHRGFRGVTKEGGAAPEGPLSINLYVTFAYDSADLTQDARITLDRLGTALNDPKLAAFTFVVAGHTDARGADEYNLKLSQRRADAVVRYLADAHRVAAGRLSAVGHGKRQLLDPERPEDEVNRRVQVINTKAGG